MTGKGPLAVASTAAATATDVTSDAARLSVVLADAFGKVFMGTFDSAGTPIVEGYELAERLSSPHDTVRLGITDALRHFLSGDLDRAREVVERWLRLADVSMVRPAHAVWLGLAAELASFEGDYARAILRGREAVRAADHVDDIGAGGFVRGELRAVLAELAIEADPHPGESPLGRARAEVRLAALDDVDVMAGELTRKSVDAGYLLWAPWIGLEALRRGSAERTAPLVLEIADGIDGLLAEATVAFAAGMAERDVRDLARAVELFLAAGASAPALDALLAEIDVAVESGADTITIRRHLLAARSLASGLTPNTPPRIAERLAEVSDRIEMPSDRQLEIARLVAEGKSSKDVAAELVVSARTVDNHLAAVYRRFGIAGRHELSDLPL
jgi:DNA-binding CsgD family transcriptional regulator